MNILMICYRLDPASSSEGAAGWSWLSAAASRHDVTVISPGKEIARMSSALDRLGVGAAASDPPKCFHILWFGGRLEHIYYFVWLYFACRTAQLVSSSSAADVMHHLVFATDWMPSFVSVLDVPHVWGPVGGSTSPNRKLWKLARYLGFRGFLTEALRSVVTRLFRTVFGRTTSRRTAVLLAQNFDVELAYRRATCKVIVEPNPAVDPPALGDTGSKRHPTRAVFAGRFEASKCIPLAIHAMATAPLADWELLLVGDGSHRDRCERLVGRLGLRDRVHFLGHLPRSDTLETISSASVLIYPSCRDGAPWVVAEAQSVGTPPVCLDIGATRTMIEEAGGVLVAWNADLVDAFATACVLAARGHATLDSSRWRTARLPDLLDGIYTDAIQSGFPPTDPYR